MGDGVAVVEELAGVFATSRRGLIDVRRVRVIVAVVARDEPVREVARRESLPASTVSAWARAFRAWMEHQVVPIAKALGAKAEHRGRGGRADTEGAEKMVEREKRGVVVPEWAGMDDFPGEDFPSGFR